MMIIMIYYCHVQIPLEMIHYKKKVQILKLMRKGYMQFNILVLLTDTIWLRVLKLLSGINHVMYNAMFLLVQQVISHVAYFQEFSIPNSTSLYMYIGIH